MFNWLALLQVTGTDAADAVASRTTLELGAVWAAIIGLAGTVLLGVLAPFVQNYFRARTERNREQLRRHVVLRLLMAEFGNVARHSATNLRRITEMHRSQRTVAESIVSVRKMSIKHDEDQGNDALFSTAGVEDLSLLPEHLSRDIMRIQLIARNIEYDVTTTVEALEANAKMSDLFDPSTEGPAQSRMRSLSKTIERCAQDSAELISKLKIYENKIGQSEIVRSTGLASGTERFQDRPIHFDDAASLREVADWSNWKEEQRLLSVQNTLAVLAKCLGDSIPEEIKIDQQFFGTINLITECSSPKGKLCLRIRVNESIFQYEKGLVKEAAVALAMAKKTADGGDGYDDELFAHVVREAQDRIDCKGHVPFSLGPDIHFYSSRTRIDENRWFPLMIADWAKGEILGADNSEQAFEALGRQIKTLHSLKFEKFYRNFRDLGQYRFARDFVPEIIGELRARNQDVGLFDESRFEKRLASFADCLKKAETEDKFVLCHNDLHVNNVFVRKVGEEFEVEIVDWDNACVSHRFFDFVKIKYWGTIGKGRRFEENEAYFSSFCAGYGLAAKDVLKSDVFTALSALWLFRVYMFELKREAAGTGIPEPFLPANHYAGKLKSLFKI